MLNGGRILRKRVALILFVVFCVPFTFLILQRDDGKFSIDQ